jgi:membrane protein DedA with SNARE-associated domain
MAEFVTWLQEQGARMVAEYTYAGAFLMLMLCGFGLPLPEEITVIASGMLLHQEEHVVWWLIGPVCIAGVVLGDGIPFTLGRVWGKRALRNRFVSRLIDERTYARLERRFREHGNWATFSCRFVPGLRWPGYFMAGTMRMPYWRWFLIDLAGASIQVPTVLYLGWLFADNVERLDRSVKGLNLILAFAILAILLLVVFRSRLARWRRHTRLREERRRTAEARSAWAAERAATQAARRAAAMAQFSPSRTTDPPTSEPR